MRGITKNLFIAICCIILSLILSGGVCLAAGRKTISVVFSKNAEPYLQTIEGFESFFDENKIPVRISRHNLENNDRQAVFSGIKEEKPDLIFTVGALALQEAKEEINETPVVFSMVLDPGPITPPVAAGVLLDVSFDSKFEYIKNILPGEKNIGLVYSPESQFLYENAARACSDAKYKLISRKIGSKTEFPDVMKDLSERIDCFLILPDAEIYYDKLVENLLRESLKSKFSVIGPSSAYVKAGALIAFECDYKDTGNQAGELAFNVLSGQIQSDQRCLSPRKVKFSLNLITAEMLGIKIPPDMLKQASKVYGK